MYCIDVICRSKRGEAIYDGSVAIRVLAFVLTMILLD